MFTKTSPYNRNSVISFEILLIHSGVGNDVLPAIFSRRRYKKTINLLLSQCKNDPTNFSTTYFIYEKKKMELNELKF